jgi:cytochrome P450
MTDTASQAGAALTDREAYDHFAPEDRPQSWFYDEWDARRRECPVSHSARHGGFYLLTRYEDVFNALTDTETFSSASGAAIPPQPFQFIPEDIDPPRHRQYRKVVNAALSPQAVTRHTDVIREKAIALLEPLEGRTQFDLVRDFAGPFPRDVALELIGVPTEDLAKISEWTEVLTFTPRDNPEGQQAGADLFGYLGAFVASRAGEPPRDDLVSLIVGADIDGEPMPPLEQMSYVALLLFGGLHTTTHAIAGFLVALAERPELRRRLIDEPELMTAAVEEALRYTSPSSHLGRLTTRDVELGGCPIPAGSRVMASLGSANFDPQRFDDARAIRLDRGAAPNAAFGLGPHRCVGSHLAKLQMAIAYSEFLKRFPDYTVDLVALRYAGAEVRGLTTAPIEIVR